MMVMVIVVMMSLSGENMMILVAMSWRRLPIAFRVHILTC
jgi:hypothetical protein